MNYISKGLEKAAIATKEDAKCLMRALSDYDCKESVFRQDLVGKDVSIGFHVCFDDEEIAVCTQEDALMITRWMLDLDCKSVEIKRYDK